MSRIEKDDFFHGIIAFGLLASMAILLASLMIGRSPYLPYSALFNITPGAIAGGLVGALIVFIITVEFLADDIDNFSALLAPLIIISVIPLFFDFFLPWWLFIILALAIGEIVFWIDKKKPTKDRSKFWFTAERKAICIGISTIAVAIGMGVVNLIRWAIPWIEQYWEAIVVWFGYIGIGVGAILLFGFIAWCYIKLNSLKYRGKDKPYKGPEFRRKTIGNRNLKYGEIHNQLHRESKHHVHKIGYMACTEEV